MRPPPDRIPARAPTRSVAGWVPAPWRKRAVIMLAGSATLLFGYALPAQSARPSDIPATAIATDGAALFLEHCGICHLKGGTGTFMLGRRLGKQHALLADRTDLPVAYIKAIVRNGLNGMPAFTRVEITDDELDAVAEYLAPRHANARAVSPP